MKFSIKKMIYSALFLALITIGAWIKIPVLFVPITLQVLFVLLTGFLSPTKTALSSITLYIIIGLIGLPVFAEGGGIGYLLRPSFGYLLGFIISIIIIEVLKGNRQDFKRNLLVSLIALISIYGIGILYFLLLQYFYFGQTFQFTWILYHLVFLYLPGDLLSCLLAVVIYKRIVINM